MGATHDQLRTDTGEVYDEAQRRYESLADVSAVELQGDSVPSNPSPGDILRSTGTQWEHARPEFPAEGFGADPANADNRSAIKGAIDAAISAGGGVVSIREPGTYEVQDPGQNYVFQILNDDITFYCGSGVTIRIADSQIGGSEVLNLFRIGDGTTAVSNFHLIGPGKLDGNEANNSTTANQPQSAVVRIEGPVEDVVISVSDIVDGLQGGVFINGESDASRAKRITVQGVHFDGLAGDGVLWQKANDVKVLDNRFTDCGPQDPIEPASSSKDWVVRGNTILDTVANQTAIDVFANTGVCEDGIVEGNIIRGGSGADLRIGGGASDTVRRITVRGNYMIDGEGVEVGDSSTVEDILIDGNVIVRSGVNGVRVAGGAVGVRVIHNTVIGSQENGIELNTGLTDALVAFNRCHNNGQAGTAGAEAGIFANGTTDARLIGNTCKDDQGTATQQYGIKAQSATRPTIRDSVFDGHGTVDLDTQSATDVTLRNNEGPDIGSYSGTATVASGSTTKTVTTGHHSFVEGAFDLADVSVTPTNDPTNDVGNFWVDNLVVSGGNVTFDINVGSDPGSGGATFAWTIQP